MGHLFLPTLSLSGSHWESGAAEFHDLGRYKGGDEGRPVLDKARHSAPLGHRVDSSSEPWAPLQSRLISVSPAGRIVMWAFCARRLFFLSHSREARPRRRGDS